MGDFVIKKSTGGSQTPWTSDIDGGGFKLTDVTEIDVTAGGVTGKIKSNDTDTGGGHPCFSFRSPTQGILFEGYSSGAGFSPFPLFFNAFGGNADNNAVIFRTDGGNVRYEMGGSGKFSSGPSDFGIDQPGYGNGGFFYDSNNVRVGIGNAAPGYTLDANGQINSAGGFVAYSAFAGIDGTFVAADFAGKTMTVNGGIITSFA